jgi:hypothetical protein
MKLYIIVLIIALAWGAWATQKAYMRMSAKYYEMQKQCPIDEQPLVVSAIGWTSTWASVLQRAANELKEKTLIA